MPRRLRAVILAGGLGTRLRPYTLFMPKPMLPLGDKPVLEHLIQWLKQHQITDISISVAYLRRIIEDYFRSGTDLGVKINYIRTNRPLGIAGQLKAAEEYVKDTFLCLYGDAVFNFNLNEMIRYHFKAGALVTMALMPYRTTLKYGFIKTNGEGKVVKWDEKPEVHGLINIGCYLMQPRFLRYIPSDRMYGMDEAFRDAVKANEPVYGFKAKGDFIDIGDRKAYATAYERYLEQMGRIL